VPSFYVSHVSASHMLSRFQGVCLATRTQRTAPTHASLGSHADTEIDWIAYMQEVEGWSEAGDTNYSNLKGDTGPLVYPAGFLYIFRLLRWITGGGRGPAAIRIAQWLFVLVYVATQGVVLAMYRKARCVQRIPESSCPSPESRFRWVPCGLPRLSSALQA